MSHGHHRTEKDCLNCGTLVMGRYCHDCGQENVEPKETVWHMVRHFFEDITHFDGKFFSTMKAMLLKPGFVAEEYMKGRRMSYLHPIRMYLFMSAVFFVAFFTFFAQPARYDPVEARIRDSVEQDNFLHDKRQGFSQINKDFGNGRHVYLLRFDARYALTGKRAYDSIQLTLPAAERDAGFDRFVNRRTAEAARAYHLNPSLFISKMSANFFHSLAKIFFIVLPFFAFTLQLLYIRRKQYYFGAHAVFSIHFFCASFVFLFFASWMFVLGTKVSAAFAIVSILTIIGMYAYLYVAMRRFYRQHWAKTLLKFFVQSGLFTFLLLFCTFILWINSILSISEI